MTHVRDKLMELIAWTETTRGLLVAASMEHKVVPPGIAVPNTTLTNIAKHHFARNYHSMVQNLQDIAGGLLVTAPSRKDWENEATRKYLDHYLGGVEGVSGVQRTRAMKLIRDIAASGFGGYQEILSIHAEGSLGRPTDHDPARLRRQALRRDREVVPQRLTPGCPPVKTRHRFRFPELQ